jgi:uncharacterized protein YbaR (Trm112 family)
MLPVLLDYLACPVCGADLVGEFREFDGDHVMTGVLTCGDCDSRFAIAGGVPRMNTQMEGLESVSRTFGFQWKTHHEGKFEQGTVYGYTPEVNWRDFVERLGTSDVSPRSTERRPPSESTSWMRSTVLSLCAETSPMRTSCRET